MYRTVRECDGCCGLLVLYRYEYLCTGTVAGQANIRIKDGINVTNTIDYSMMVADVELTWQDGRDDQARSNKTTANRSTTQR